jgi:hypothetical protein
MLSRFITNGRLLHTHIQHTASNKFVRLTDAGIMGADEPSIITIQPHYSIACVTLGIYHPLEPLYFLVELGTSSLNLTPQRHMATPFEMCGSLDSFQFKSFQGLLYLSDNGFIHTDGGPQYNDTEFRQINLNQLTPIEHRADYMSAHQELSKSAIRAIGLLLPNQYVSYTIQHVESRLYLGIDLVSFCSIENKLTLFNELSTFHFRMASCDSVYLSQKTATNKYLNVYNACGQMYFGAPDCVDAMLKPVGVGKYFQLVVSHGQCIGYRDNCIRSDMPCNDKNTYWIITPCKNVVVF